LDLNCSYIGYKTRSFVQEHPKNNASRIVSARSKPQFASRKILNFLPKIDLRQMTAAPAAGPLVIAGSNIRLAKFCPRAEGRGSGGADPQ
jgi:hypothetical protein